MKKPPPKPDATPTPSNLLPFEEVRDRAAKRRAARKDASRPRSGRVEHVPFPAPPLPPPFPSGSGVERIPLGDFKTMVFHEEGKVCLSHRHQGREVFSVEYDVAAGLVLGKQIIEAVRTAAELLEVRRGAAPEERSREQEEERLRGIFRRPDITQAMIDVALRHQVDVHKMFAYGDESLFAALGHLWAVFMHQERSPQLVKAPGWAPVPRWWLAEMWSVPEVTVQYLSETYTVPPKKRR